MTINYKPLSREEWSSYWKNDSLTTFMQTFPENYNLEIKDFWFDCFRTLPDNAKILDIATGNGAIALLAMQYSQKYQKNFCVIGIDLADISPSDYLTLSINDKELLNRIKFISNTNIESSNLRENSFDAAISQYGLEYSNLERSIPEVRRILKPRGKLFSILHSHNSKIVIQAKESLEQIDICLARSNLLMTTKDLITKIGSINTRKQLHNLEKNSEIRLLREKYNKSVQIIEIEISHFENPYISDYILSSLNKILQKPLYKNEADKHNKLKSIISDVNSYKKRMDDLLFATINQSKYQLLTDLLKLEHFSVHLLKDFYYKKNDNLGYQLKAELHD